MKASRYLRKIRSNFFYLAYSSWSFGIADQMVVSAGNFLGTLIVARSCSKAEFGLFSLGMTIVCLFIDVHISTVSVPQYIRSPHLTGRALMRYTGSTLMHQLTISAFLALGLGVGAIAFSHEGKSIAGLQKVLVAIALVIVFTLFREYVRRLSFLREWMQSILFQDCAIVALQSFALVVCWKAGSMTPAIAHTIMGAVCCLFSVIWLIYRRSHFCVVVNDVWPDLMTNLRIGKWVLPASLVSSISTYAYPWLIASSSYGTEGCGVYAACMSIMAVANIPLGGVINLLTPKFASVYAEGDIGALRVYVKRASIAFTGFAFTLAGIPLLFGEKLLTFLYGPSYHDYGIMFEILALNICLSAPWICSSKGLLVIGRMEIDFMLNLIPVVVMLTLGRWSVDSYGAVGAALGITIANGLSSIARILAFEWASRHTMPNLHPAPVLEGE